MEALAEAFAVGVLTVASPCLLPIYPAFVAFLAGGASTTPRRLATAASGLVILAGLLVAMLAAGIVITLASLPLGAILAWLVPIADVVLIALGLLLVAGRNPFARLPGPAVPTTGGALRRAFVYGLLLGPIALPCAGAFLVALLAIALDPVDATVRLSTFVAFGFGFGSPLLILSLVSAARGQVLARWIAAHHRPIDTVGGVLLVAIGALDLLARWRSA